MRFRLRPCDLPGDFARMVEMYNTNRPEPVTVEQLQDWFAKVPPEALLLMVSAVDESDRMVGYAEASQMRWSNKGRFYADVIVDPAVRKQGLGSMLLDRVEAFAVQHDATEIDSDVRDNKPDDQAFAAKRGYKVRRHLFESTLDLATFDDSRFVGVVEAVRETGIQFYTLADRSGDAFERELYELDKETTFDIPGFDQKEVMPFDQWRKYVLQSPDLIPDCFLVAADGDRLAGMSRMEQQKETGAMYTHYTAVRKAYRGRRVALALKLVAVEAARRYGAPYMRTNNDSENIPMLTVNRTMGYLSAPGVYFLRKELQQA